MTTRYYIDEYGQFIIADLKVISLSLGRKKITTGDVEFIPDSENITHQQRKYFFGVLAKLIKERFYDLGNEDVTIPDVVDFLKEKYLNYEKLCPITGKYIKVPYSLGNNDKGMPIEIFTEKKELIQKFGAEILGINLPDPDPRYKMFK